MVPFNLPLSPTINACTVILPLTENRCIVMSVLTLMYNQLNIGGGIQDNQTISYLGN